METFLQDLRYAFRTLRRSPGFTFVAVACMTLGIATNTTIFSVFNTILLRPYDFRDPEQLVVVQEQRVGTDDNMGTSWLTYRDWREQATSFSDMAAVSGRGLAITEGEEPELLEGSAITWNLFPMLGKRAQLGRVFREDEDQPGSPPTVLLGDVLWRRRYLADPAIVGRVISVNNVPRTVVGVMPPRFAFPETAELWIPAAPVSQQDRRNDNAFRLYARVKEAVTLDAASREVAALVKRTNATFGIDRKGWAGEARPLRDEFIPPDVKVVTIAMMGAVVFVLLIAIANVANLMLTRATARGREMAIRAAIGAGRGRIVRQLITESVVVALMAGVLAVPLTRLGLTMLDRSIPAEDPLPYYIHWSLDRTTLWYTLGISVLTGVLFGLAPAWQAGRGALQAALREGGRGPGTGVRKNRLRSTLVIAEVALSLVLLVGASLFVRSFRSLDTFNVGFDPAPIMTMRYYLAGSRYDSVSARALLVQDVVRRVSELPMVSGAASANLVPMGGGGSGAGVEVEGKTFARGEERYAQWTAVSGQWFETLGVRLLDGRDFAATEREDSAAVAVVNQRMARQLWPQGGALGRRFRMAGDSAKPWFTVIGVSTDFRHYGPVNDNTQPMAFYLPYKWLSPRHHGLIVRTIGPPLAAASAIRAAIRASDPGVPVYEMRTMDDQRRSSFWQFGLFGRMFSIFGGIALVLAAVGIYGVIAFGVAQRTQEIGVRVALGAQRRDVLGLVIGQGMSLAGIGIAIGIAGAFGVTRGVKSLLYGVTATDPVSFIAVALFLAVVAAVASWVPARRATAVDPIVALRVD